MKIMRFEGGPLDGSTVPIETEAWPLPDVLGDRTELPLLGELGRYVKISESQLAEDIPHVARGALYRWEPG